MRDRRLRTAAATAILANMLVLGASHSSAREKKVLAIGLDGLRPDALVAANAPNMKSLVNGTFFGTSGPSGIFSMNAQSEHLTFSGPGWGAFMTGLHVDRHGADTNEFENVVPGTTDWFTPLEAFNPSLNTHRVLTWTIAHTSIPSGADTAEVYEYSSNGDVLMTNRAVQLMQTTVSDATMLFYSDVDVAGHQYGFDPNSPQYLAAIDHDDAEIGRVLTAIKNRPTYANEDWLVIVTSDHGGLGTNHFGGLPPQRTIPFIVAGPLATTVLPQANPRQVDVAATVLTYFGAPIPANYDGHAIGLTAAGPAPSTFWTNLVFNGDAEYGRGFSSNGTQQYAAGWDDPGPGGITMVNYLAGDGFPDPMSPGPADRGANFFSGGTNATSTMTQRIDVGNLAGAIGAGNVDVILSAWLGGYSSQGDSATVIAHYLDASLGQVGQQQLAAVTAAERGNVTGMLPRNAFGGLPATTRYIDLELTATRATGENDGYADNISLTLALAGDLNKNSVIDAGDWGVFRSHQFANLAGLSPLDAYLAGDLNGDGRNDHADFVAFKGFYEAAHGTGSFATMLATVPEPASVGLATFFAGCVFVSRRRA